MRRRVSFGSQIASVMRPIMMGKIQAYSWGWRYGSEGATNPNGVYLKPSKSDDGQDVSLYKRRSVTCPCPEMGTDRPVIRGRWWIPETECKKCPHRLKGGCCAVLRKNAINSLKKPLEDIEKGMEPR